MSLLALDDDLGTVPSGCSRCIRSRARASSRRIRSRARASSRRIRLRRSVPRASPLPRAAPELANLIAPVRTCPRERTQRSAFLGTQEEISSRRSPAAHHAREPRTLRPARGRGCRGLALGAPEVLAVLPCMHTHVRVRPMHSRSDSRRSTGSKACASGGVPVVGARDARWRDPPAVPKIRPDFVAILAVSGMRPRIRVLRGF